eukprot:COSAG01_NODE_8155_length_2898_cov_5.062522_3_plen_193_part_00
MAHDEHQSSWQLSSVMSSVIRTSMLCSAAHTWLAASTFGPIMLLLGGCWRAWLDCRFSQVDRCAWRCCCWLAAAVARIVLLARAGLYLQPRCHVPRAHTGLYGGLGPWVVRWGSAHVFAAWLGGTAAAGKAPIVQSAAERRLPVAAGSVGARCSRGTYRLGCLSRKAFCMDFRLSYPFSFSSSGGYSTTYCV